MHYWEPVSARIAQVQEDLASGDPKVVGEALLRVAYSDEPVLSLVALCLPYLNAEVTSVRSSALVALGVLARSHPLTVQEALSSALEPLRTDPEIGGKAEDVLSDLAIFVAKARSASD